MLQRIILFLFTIFSFSAGLWAQCPFTVAVSSTESRCRESGTITVTPSTAGLYTYEVTSGPVLADEQNGRTFYNKPAGGYVVTTTLAGCSLNTFVTVPGDYEEPGLLTATATKVVCPGGTGCITANQPTLGRSPWTYSITTGPVTRPLQSSNVFCGLPGGTYTVQATDSCSIVRSSQFTVPVDTGDFYCYTYGYSLTFANCNDLIVPLLKGFMNTSSHSLMMIWYIKPNGDTLKINGFEQYNSPNDTLVGEAHSYGTWTVLAYDTCGRLRKSTFPFSAPGFYGSVSGASCGTYTYQIANSWKYGQTVTYTVRKCRDNSIVGTVTQVPPATGWNSPDFTLNFDTCYTFEEYNTCGDTVRSWPISYSKSILNLEGCSGPACNMNGKADLTVWNQYGTGTPPITFRIISGPEGVGSTVVQGGGASWVNYRNLALGTYVVEGTDACGLKDTVTVIANKPLIRTLQVTQTAHCSGGSNLHLKLSSNFYNCNSITWYGSVYGPDFNGSNPSITPTNVTSSRTTLTTPGTWEADFIDVRSSSFTFSTYTYEGCSWDTTFNVNLYTAPVIHNARGYICPVTNKGTMSFRLSGGAAPYQYRVKESGGGGSWSGWKSTPIFDSLSPGLYDVEVQDSCPNGSITSVTFGSWSKADLFASAPCVHFGEPMTVYADPAVRGVTYQWLFNGAFLANGSSFTIDDFEYANVGNYQLRQVFPGGSCVDTSALFMSNCVILPVNISRLLGERQNGIVTLNWRTFDHQAGIHFIIERSKDGENFYSIGTVDGNPATAGNNYYFQDKNPLSTGFYRVKILMTDGSTVYSNIIKLFDLSDIPVISVTPVPFSNNLSVQINSKTKDSYTIRLIDLTGKIVCKKNALVNAGINNFYLDDGIESLTAGIYIIDVSSAYYSYKLKIIKQQ